MTITPGTRVSVEVTAPAAGGRMVARHEGQVVLVSGAIPGERVAAAIERVGKGVLFARAIEIERASPDRRAADTDWRCGGHAFAHVSYPRQLRLKGEIIADAFARIGRHDLGGPPDVLSSPERGYRTRARLHASGGRVGFVREDSHEVCDAASTGQLSDAAADWVNALERRLTPGVRAGMVHVDLAESVDGTQLVAHVVYRGRQARTALAPLAEGLHGLSVEAGQDAAVQLAGSPILHERMVIGRPDGGMLTLSRDVRSFFQGNRFLLPALVGLVLDAVREGPLLDLYAGVGLFGLAARAAGVDEIVLVEGDPQSAADLRRNAASQPGVRTEGRSVERYLASHAGPAPRTVVLDPPRTGLSKDALAGLVRLAAPRLIYVSCDMPTLARDVRALLGTGYALTALTGLDLFPNTAHVEAVAVIDRLR